MDQSRRRESFWDALKRNAASLLLPVLAIALLVLVGGAVPLWIALSVNFPVGVVLAVGWILLVITVGNALSDWMNP